MAAEYFIAPLIGNKITRRAGRDDHRQQLDKNEYLAVQLPQLPFDDAIQNAIVKAVSPSDPQATFKQLAFRKGCRARSWTARAWRPSRRSS
jgi:hypothetical protein